MISREYDKLNRHVFVLYSHKRIKREMIRAEGVGVWIFIHRWHRRAQQQLLRIMFSHRDGKSWHFNLNALWVACKGVKSGSLSVPQAVQKTDPSPIPMIGHWICATLHWYMPHVYHLDQEYSVERKGWSIMRAV